MRNRTWRWVLALASGLVIWGSGAATAGWAAGQGHEACDSCHASVLGRSGGALPDAGVCLECHSPASLQPVPLAGDPWPAHYLPDSSMARSTDCLTCHDPHALDRAGRIREVASVTGAAEDLDRGSRLCLQCHESYAAFGGTPYSRHPVGIRVPGGLSPSADPASAPLVDVDGTQDPRDDVIACTTCHTVHERRERDLLRWIGREGMIAGCTACHDLVGGRGRDWVSTHP